jgi:hypothetical protein
MKLSDGQTEPSSFVAKWATDTITAAMEMSACCQASTRLKLVPVAADRMGFALNKAMLCIEQESDTEEGVYRSR